MNSPDPEASKLVSHLIPSSSRVFPILFLFLFFFNFFKTIKKNAHYKLSHQNLCNSPKIHMGFLFFFVAKKRMFSPFFQE